MINGTLQYILVSLAQESSKLSTHATNAALLGTSDLSELEQSFNDVYSLLVLVQRILNTLNFPDEVSVAYKLKKLGELSQGVANLGGIAKPVADNLQECIDICVRELN
jgi:hypothetical protein